MDECYICRVNLENRRLYHNLDYEEGDLCQFVSARPANVTWR